jgi:hypothetical protein
VSIAGDETRKDINTTKIEMALLCALGRKPTLKLTFKPNIDWTQNARTGAVLELEGRVRATRPVAIWLMAGTRLWGPGVPGTYEKRVELGLSWRS